MGVNAPNYTTNKQRKEDLMTTGVIRKHASEVLVDKGCDRTLR
jgi:hypothetical protein